MHADGLVQSLDGAYTEVERLSVLFEALEQQVASKVFNLASAETKMWHLAGEVRVARCPTCGRLVYSRRHAQKAKTEAKYFAARSNTDLANQQAAAMEKTVQLQRRVIATLRASDEDSRQRLVIDCDRCATRRLRGTQIATEQSLTQEKKSELQLRQEIANIQAQLSAAEIAAREARSAKEQVRRASSCRAQAFVNPLQADAWRKQQQDKVTAALKTEAALRSSFAGESSKVAQLKQQLEQSKKSTAATTNGKDLQTQLDWSMVRCSSDTSRPALTCGPRAR